MDQNPSSMPLATGFEPSMAGELAQNSELAPIDREIAAQSERISHQAALIALLESNGECTILANAQLGAMEQYLSALWVRRETIVSATGGPPL